MDGNGQVSDGSNGSALTTLGGGNSDDLGLLPRTFTAGCIDGMYNSLCGP